jgi:hypothetical protein
MSDSYLVFASEFIAVLLFVTYLFPRNQRSIIQDANNLSKSPLFRTYFNSPAHRPRNCSISLIVLAADIYLLHPVHFTAGRCHIRHTFIYIHSGAGINSFRTAGENLDQNYSDGKIVRTDLDDHDLFGLSLAIYYESDFVMMIDIAHFQSFDSNWISSGIDLICSGYADLITPHLEQGIATHAVLMKSSFARRFLLYTDVKYTSEHVMTVLSSLCLCNQSFGRIVTFKGANELIPVTARPIPCDLVPHHWTYCHRSTPRNATLAILLPVWKRNLLSDMLKALKQQTYQPDRIIVFQNQAHRTFDFRPLMKLCPVPLHHVWLTNWNSYFFMTYIPMGFLHEPYTLKMDDDQIPTDTRAIEKYVTIMKTLPNRIIGAGGGDHSGDGCGLAENHGPYNHVAAFVMFHSDAAKILHRFRYDELFSAEDISLSLTNLMECGTSSLLVSVRLDDLIPQLAHGNDPEFMRLHSREYRYSGRRVADSTYCHYLRGNYHLEQWSSQNDTRGVDIRWPWH